MSSEPLKSSNSNPLDLSGLEDLLERAQLEVVTSAPDVEAEVISSKETEESPTEAKLVLDLLNHLMQVNELVVETNRRLNMATSRLGQLDEMLTAQSVWLERLPALEVKAAQLEDVQLKLELATAENEWLKKSWINKFLSAIKDRN
ncbi:MAG TPA: hypothetical protein EYN91_27095 [Candidatus Melainabacteria bacterium]|jgi:hypothetical protein|nr:hypothetical protein [Candidatus Melainabacteria bacterium]HIN63240.1 hypothetical protein [Candidatus Obscuribacterales bacterium]